jgi:hypothetical protein
VSKEMKCPDSIEKSRLVSRKNHKQAESESTVSSCMTQNQLEKAKNRKQKLGRTMERASFKRSRLH